MKKSACWATLVSCLAVFLQVGALGAANYKYQDLSPQGLLAGATYSFTAINDARQIVGYYSVYNPATGYTYQAFLWDPVKGSILLQSLGCTNSHAYGINKHGQIVGQVANDNSGMNTQACFWTDPSQAPTALGVLSGGYAGSWASAINDNGLIVGVSTNSSITRACKWTLPSLQPVDLGTFANNSSASGVNNAGQIVGNSVNNLGYNRPCIWNAGQLTPQDLAKTLPNGSTPKTINIKGNVAGVFSTPYQLFYLELLTGAINLIGGNGYPIYYGGLNDSNRLVGTASYIGGPPTPFPFSWTPIGEYRDLNTRVVNLPQGVTIVGVSAISPQKGYIVVTDSQGHVCLLTPVPASTANILLLLE